MGLRLFKKPELKGKGESNLSTGEKSTPIPSRFLKRLEVIRESPRAKYLRELEAKIFAKERELESIIHTTNETKRHLDETLAFSSAEIRKQIDEIESVLNIKRAERVELEKPFNDRMKVLDEREKQLDKRSESLDEATQSIFERERATQVKLEGIQDLADTLGETRVRLSVKENLLNGREKLIKNSEMQYLVRVNELEDKANKLAVHIQERENAVLLKELNVQSKEENICNREEALLNERLLVQSQRQALLAAKK